MKIIQSLCLAAFVFAGCAPQTMIAAPRSAPPSIITSQPLGQIVAMRRLSETQYRNSIADIFGPDIKVAGKFEPIVRPQHQLISTGATSATISPAGLEQFDAMARNIAAQVFDDAHRTSFASCAPKDLAKADDACARDVLAPIGRYLFRRPQTTQELAGYVNIAADAATKNGSFYKGLELALASMLVAPDFLYVIESAEPDPAHPGTQRIDDYSRAARLSFLLWNTTPNETLLAAAARGDLQDQGKLETIANKMVASPRFEGGVRAFFADMLVFEKFDEIAKDSVVFPRFNPDVAKALPEQMLRTITDQLVTRGGDYRALFTTRQTVMTRALGPVYQVPIRATEGWQPYVFAQDDDRAGLLSLAGFLALYSHSGRSSPTLRGRAVRELVMCQPVPNPPGNVSFTAVQDIHNTARPTARDRLTVHRSDPACAGCHVITDPIGLSLERFDGIGVWRKTENGAVIDTSAQIDEADITGAAGLGKALAANPATTQCAANRAFEYAIGRQTDDWGDALALVQKDFSAHNFSISKLFAHVASMPEAYRVSTEPTKTALNRTGVTP